MSENIALDSLESYKGETLEQILLDLLAPGNVTMKTEFPNPLLVSRIRMASKWAELQGLEQVAEFLKQFVTFFETDMVSYKRQSRTEIVTAVSEIVKHDRKVREKLVGDEGLR